MCIEQSEEYSDVEITIHCSTIDKQLERLIEQIRLYGFALHGKKDGTTVLIAPEDIFYFESIEGKTFIYKDKEVYAGDFSFIAYVNWHYNNCYSKGKGVTRYKLAKVCD